MLASTTMKIISHYYITQTRGRSDQISSCRLISLFPYFSAILELKLLKESSQISNTNKNLIMNLDLWINYKAGLSHGFEVGHHGLLHKISKIFSNSLTRCFSCYLNTRNFFVNHQTQRPLKADLIGFGSMKYIITYIIHNMQFSCTTKRLLLTSLPLSLQMEILLLSLESINVNLQRHFYWNRSLRNGKWKKYKKSSLHSL